jgi:hypothetical protein
VRRLGPHFAEAEDVTERLDTGHAPNPRGRYFCASPCACLTGRIGIFDGGVGMVTTSPTLGGKRCDSRERISVNLCRTRL